MPGLDKKGPEGQGSKTGRGLGRSNPDFDEKLLDRSAGKAGLSTRQRLGFGRSMGKSIGRSRRNRVRGS